MSTTIEMMSAHRLVVGFSDFSVDRTRHNWYPNHHRQWMQTLTRIHVHRIRLPRLPVGQLLVAMLDRRHLGERLALRQLLGQIGRSLLGQSGHHAAHRIRAAAHVLLDRLGDRLQQHAAAVQVPDRLDRRHIAGQNVVGVDARMQQAQLQRLLGAAHQLGAPVIVLEDAPQIVDGRLRVGKVDDDVEELLDQRGGVRFIQETGQLDAETAHDIGGARVGTVRRVVDAMQPVQHDVVQPPFQPVQVHCVKVAACRPADVQLDLLLNEGGKRDAGQSVEQLHVEQLAIGFAEGQYQIGTAALVGRCVAAGAFGRNGIVQIVQFVGLVVCVRLHGVFFCNVCM